MSMDILELVLLYVSLAGLGIGYINLLEKYNELKSEVNEYAEKN